jgi:Alkyl hydroperoxide reductase, large subunit
MKTLKDYLKSLDACEPAIDWAGDKPVEQVVAECHRGDWLLWLAQKCGVELQPLTLVKGHCANTVRHLMTDESSLKAVDVAIAFGEGRATREELDAAARAAASAASSAAAYAADAAFVASAASAAASAAAYAAAAYSAYSANQQATADICRKYIGDLIIEKVNQTLNP